MIIRMFEIYLCLDVDVSINEKMSEIEKSMNLISAPEEKKEEEENSQMRLGERERRNAPERSA